jgi:MraZ protein
VFLGTHQPRLDEKGRLFLPAKYREELAGGVVITRGQEHCLFVWPRDEFARITEKLRNS